MKKYLFTILTLALFAVGFAASDEEESASNSNEQKQEQNVESKEEQKEEKKEVNSIVGTYEVTDNVGCTIRITLNEDETATITGVRSENITYYCTWTDQSYHKNRMALIEFSDFHKRPYLVFDGGTTEKFSSTCFLSKDGWFYYSVVPETNNPEWRLKATKIK